MKPKLISYKDAYYIIKTTIVEFVRDHSLNHGAALGYYMVLALIPMIYLAVEISGYVVGDKEYMIDAIQMTLAENIGEEPAKNLSSFLGNVSFSEASWVNQVIGIGALLFTSTAIFMALKRSINHFWNLHPVREKIVVRSVLFRLLSFGFLILTGMLIIFSYFTQVALASFSSYFESGFLSYFDQSLDWISTIFSLVTNVVLFTLIFKFLHDGVIKLKLAFWGAVFTALLMYLGQYLLKMYMGNMYFSSRFGIAGSFLMILTYVFYSSQIVFLGAKFIYVYAKVSGNPILQKK